MKSKTGPYRELPHILFSFGEMFTIGSISCLFLTAYLTFDDTLFFQRISIYHSWLKFFWLIGLAGLSIFIISLRVISGGIPANEQQSNYLNKREIFIFTIFLTLSGIVIGAHYLAYPIDVINFIAFLAGIFVLFSVAKQYTFAYDRPAWKHPTTAGMFIQGAVTTGSAMGLWIYDDTRLQGIFLWVLIITLVLEALTIWNRLRYLNRASAATRQTVTMILGSHLMLFGVRFIFGIVMPLVYLLWFRFISTLPLNPVVIMILVGELSDRILFFVTSPSAPAEEQPVSENTAPTGN